MSSPYENKSATHWVAVSASDTVDLATIPRAIYVGTAGDVKLIGVDAPSAATGVVFKGVSAGTILPYKPRRILATGTTASDIVALY